MLAVPRFMNFRGKFPQTSAETHLSTEIITSNVYLSVNERFRGAYAYFFSVCRQFVGNCMYQ